MFPSNFELVLRRSISLLLNVTESMYGITGELSEVVSLPDVTELVFVPEVTDFSVTVSVPFSPGVRTAGVTL